MRITQRRTPASFVVLPETQPAYFGVLRRVIRWVTGERTPEPGGLSEEVFRLDPVRVPHVLESPRLVPVSLFAPITRTGVIFFRRQHMRAAPPFQNRYPLVGSLIRDGAGRERMEAITTHQAAGAFSYLTPHFETRPRVVELGIPAKPAVRRPPSKR